MMLCQLIPQAARLQRLFSRITTTPILQSLSTSSYHQTVDHRHIKKLVPNADNGLLHITWDDGTVNQYPFVYLRDICQCPECFHDSSKQRAFDSVAGLANDLVASKVDVQLGGKQVTLTWPNNHVTSFNSDWLYERRLLEEKMEKVDLKSQLVKSGIQLWDKKMVGNVPTLLFQDVLNKKLSQIKWLDIISCHGIALIKGAPTEPGQVHKLGETLGFLKEMWFGKSHQTQNNIEHNREHSSLSAVPQSLCPYDEYRGGLHLIHCQKHVEGQGGEHLFVDGFHVAQHLQHIDPEAFNLLSTCTMMFQRNVGNDDAEFHMKFARPIISLDLNGCLTRIIYNESNRTTFVHATTDEIPSLYRAYYKLTGLIRDPKYIVKQRLYAGDIITYDCDRILRGRSPFGREVMGTELIESAFTDKDMTNSRRRTLRASLVDDEV